MRRRTPGPGEGGGRGDRGFACLVLLACAACSGVVCIAHWPCSFAIARLSGSLPNMSTSQCAVEGLKELLLLQTSGNRMQQNDRLVSVEPYSACINIMKGLHDGLAPSHTVGRCSVLGTWWAVCFYASPCIYTPTGGARMGCAMRVGGGQGVLELPRSPPPSLPRLILHAHLTSTRSALFTPAHSVFSSTVYMCSYVRVPVLTLRARHRSLVAARSWRGRQWTN